MNWLAEKPVVEEAAASWEAESVAVGPVPQENDPGIYFEMGVDGYWSYHSHPHHEEFLIQCNLHMEEPNISAYLPFEARTIYFRFSDCPRNTWVSFYDDKGDRLPFQIFMEGSIRVIGRWLPLS